MATIVHFPKVNRPTVGPIEPPPAQSVGQPEKARFDLWAALVNAVWVLTTLAWPVLRRLFALDVLYHVCRAIYYNNTQATLTLIGHFAMFVAVTYFVTHRKRGR